MNLLKKYLIEIILVAILVISIVVFRSIRENNVSVDGTNDTLIDGLYPQEAEYYDSSFEYSELYLKRRHITQSDFSRYQVKNMGEAVRYILPYYQCMNGGIVNGVLLQPVVELSINRAVISESYEGMKENGYKYITLYVELKNVYDHAYVWEAYGNYVVRGFNEGDIYTAQESSGLNIASEDRITIYPDKKTKGVVKANTGYIFEEPGDKGCIYIEPGETVTCKIVAAVREEIYANKDRNLIFGNLDDGNRYNNSSFAIVMPREQIEERESME